ncbi:MAG: amidase domain-containing protein [Firmicutes bacterium]|nr:amidase domain-containing protein [Bacillota bacterium]
MIWLIARIPGKHMAAIVATLLSIALAWAFSPPVAVQVAKTSFADPKLWLKTAMEVRANALLTGDPSPLSRFYDQGALHGKWALEHEFRRLNYVKSWASKRGIRLTRAKVALQIPSVEPEGGDTVWLYLKLATTLEYSYEGDPPGTTNAFRIGTRHSIQLVRDKGSWLIRRDWYTDPLDEDALGMGIKPADPPAESLVENLSPQAHARKTNQTRPSAKDTGQGARPEGGQSASTGDTRGYNRRAAVAYAKKYWHEYNSRYKNYLNLGGDCANFVSQVLGDPREGGGLPMDYEQPPPRKGTTSTWALTDSLADLLLSSGKARRLMRGIYARVVEPTPEYPLGAVQQLEPGDLIGYEEAGILEHLAVIVGRDSRGYLLVNSHTADRYLAPWDLGWDRQTVFWLMQIVD